MPEKAYVIAVIADIHFGAQQPKDLFLQLKEYFLDKLEKLTILDAIIINGDLLDTKISMNSDNAKYFMQFMILLLNLSKKKKAKLRILKGTESHDNKQLEILEAFTEKHDEYDLKIINTASTEYLFDNFHVLYIPEEYINDRDKYYADYFNKQYDMIFGHGLVNEVAFVASKQESETTMGKAPVLKTQTLMEICKGPIFFGHIHIPQIIKDRFFYSGSFSRWCYGEESDKGFHIVTYSPITSKFVEEFIVNASAKKFDTIIIDAKSDFFKKDNILDTLINTINQYKVDHLRVIINIPEEFENPLLLTNLINEMTTKISDVKIIVNNNLKQRKKEEVENKINLLLDKYGLLFDKGKTYEEKISEYIRIKYNRNITVDKIREYLYSQVLQGAKK